MKRFADSLLAAAFNVLSTDPYISTPNNDKVLIAFRERKLKTRLPSIVKPVMILPRLFKSKKYS